MNQDELANWHKIKTHLESISKCENWFYKRAVAICAGQPDPFDRFHKMTPHLVPVDTPEPPDAA